MRTALIAVSPATLVRPQTPGVILLARDTRILISLLIRLAKRVFAVLFEGRYACFSDRVPFSTKTARGAAEHRKT
jgi:hypothetical protein